jgi:hypothetical protein
VRLVNNALQIIYIIVIFIIYNIVTRYLAVGTVKIMNNLSGQSVPDSNPRSTATLSLIFVNLHGYEMPYNVALLSGISSGFLRMSDDLCSLHNVVL